MKTTEALDRIFKAYNNANYGTDISRDDFSELELEDMESAVAGHLQDGPIGLPYALFEILNTEDWKTWQIIQMTQELS
jgi:hypothetical protein